MSTANPKITVTTVTYNAVDVIERTLESVEEQDYPHVEHIIVDGNSHDGTIEAVMHYQERGSREGHPHEIAAISEPDRGIYDAMNKGLTQVMGDYVVYMNAGDAFPAPDTLEQIARRCHLNELPSAELPAVLYGLTDIVDQEGRFLRHRRLQPPARLTWRSFRHGMLVCHQAFYARTDLAKNLQYDTQYRLSADVDWCIRVMREADRMGLPLCNINMVVANYLEGGMSIKNHRESLRERFTVMRRHYGLLTTCAMHVWFVVRAAISR